MKRILFLLLSLAISLNLTAQNFSWGFQIFPNYSGRRLIVQDPSIGESAVKEIEARETGKPSLAAGVEAGWRAEKLGFRFGLSLAETGYRTVKEPIPTDAPNPEGATDIRTVYRNYNIVVPAEIDFIHEIDSKNAFFFLLGAAGSINLANEVRETLFFGDSQERRKAPLPEENFRTVNFAFQSGLGWENQVNPGWSLYLQPTFRFWLKGLYDQDANINRSLFDLGLKMGVRFQ